MNRRESIGCAAALLSAGLALSAGAALQEKCQRLYDAVGMWWRYSKDKDADIQTLQMRTKDRK